MIDLFHLERHEAPKNCLVLPFSLGIVLLHFLFMLILVFYLCLKLLLARHHYLLWFLATRGC